MPSTHLIFCRPFSSCPQSLPETGTNGMWYRKGGRKFQTKDVRQTPSRVMIPMRHKRNLIKGKTDPTWSYLLSGSTKTMTYSSEPQFSSLQSLSFVWLFATPWTAAHQASLSINNSQSLLKLMSIKSVMPFNHLIPCCPLLFPPSIFPSIRVFFNESVLHIRWPKYWHFGFSISPNEYLGLKMSPRWHQLLTTLQTWLKEYV